MPNSLRKNSKEVKSFFEKSIKCIEIRSDVGCISREVSKETVKFNLGVKSAIIVRVIEGKKYCIYSCKDIYVMEVID